jgi:hypothetical protein
VQAVLIAEMLLLVAVDDQGRIPATVIPRTGVIKVGLSGALLIELAIDGHLLMTKGRKIRAGDFRPCDELLADVYDAVRNHLDGSTARWAIDGLSHYIGGSLTRVAGRLVEAGVLGQERSGLLFSTRYPVLDAAARQGVLAQVRAAALGGGQPRPEAAIVLQLAGRCRYMNRIAPDRRTRIDLLKHLFRMPPPQFSPDVAAVVDELLSQVSANARRIDSGRG